MQRSGALADQCARQGCLMKRDTDAAKPEVDTHRRHSDDVRSSSGRHERDLRCVAPSWLWPHRLVAGPDGPA